MGRAPCCDKANVKKGLWSTEEDAKLKSYIEQHGIGGSWISLPKKIGLRRCGKSCRLRWLNYLRPNLKHGEYSEEEDEIICRLYLTIGSRWSLISTQLPGRTDNDIKNYWNTRLKKKLLGKQQKHHRQARRATAPQQEVKIRENGILVQLPPSEAHRSASPGMADSHGETSGSSSGFPSELDEILRFDSAAPQGLDYLYEARGMAEESSGTSTPEEESTNWDEMIPFMYPDWVHGGQEIFTMQ
uniref:Uncharacterized protein n=1 Tax=Musa acuminata subsp. malaccensis TaxID=214687 RepID=A0A804JTH3_MUSAM|nr:PREDICTED: transcription factor RAX3 [Musa acuminata subsp. malaccensis]XP_018684412.1 PREDICTED: transcription factor RAX3 [Musa acuminata subsp. malaccensis]